MVVLIFRLMSMGGLAYGGYRVSVLLNNNYINGQPQQVLSIIAGIIVGLLLGYVIGGILGRYAAELLGGVENSFSSISAAELFFAVLGAMTGLLVALLPSLALFKFGYTGYAISIVLFLLFGFVGMRVGLLKRSELSALFRLGPVLGSGESKSSHILDTSVIIDGRVVDIVRAGFMDGTMLVPRFVLNELQSIADSGEALKRNRGRRGLDVLNALQRLDNVTVEIAEQDFPEIIDVDGKLIALSKLTGTALTTNDFNLARIAQIQGVRVQNINMLASALKPVVLPGEEMKVKIIREGKEPGQGVGYLDDGTMIVIEGGKKKVGAEVGVVATSVLQTPAGKMIFAELREEAREE